MTEQDPLEHYRNERSNEACSALVGRHINLVYSVALRSVSSPDLAKEVSQQVFLELLNQAPRLRRGTHLGSWLHVVTRRKAIDLIRRERRRMKYETTAAELAEANHDDATLWRSLRPQLDDALAALGDNEREAVIRRYFEGQAFRTIGKELGISEDTAQKRVSRALERMKAILAKRGVAGTTAALATSLELHAVEAAPVGLAASLAHAVPTGLPAAGGGLRTIARRSLQFATAASTATLLYLHHARAAENDRLSLLQAEHLRLAADISRAQLRRIQPVATPAATQQAAGTAEPTADILGARIRRLKDWLARFPEDGAPEMRFLTDTEWVLAVYNARGLDFYGDSDKSELQRQEWAIRGTIEVLDHEASSEYVGPALETALSAFHKDHGDQAVSFLGELTPYLPSPIEASDLAGYSVKERLTGNHQFTYYFHYFTNGRGWGWGQGNDLKAVQ